MDEIEHLLDAGEAIAYRARLSGALLAPAGLLLVVSVAAFAVGSGALGSLCLAFAGLWGIIAGIVYASCEYAVTERHLLIRMETASEPLVAVPLSGLREVQVKRGMLGRFLGYGTIRMALADGTTRNLWGVAAPDELGRRISRASGSGAAAD